jgi:mRNA-degrading endonuclease RelE of RelBE toxin-antitoxin system
MENPVYKIKFTNVSLKDFEKLDKKTKEKIIPELNLLSKSPFTLKKDIKKLKGLGANIYRLRTGDLRIIYFLSDLELVILRIIDRKDLVKVVTDIRFK